MKIEGSEQYLGQLAGLSTRWGDASPEVKETIKLEILSQSSSFSCRDQALLLAIADLESGFNPSAKASTSSAGGVFQLIKKTAQAFGLNGEEVFDFRKNIAAGIKLFIENAALAYKRYGNQEENERVVSLYALHHDGPSLSFGGEEIARNVLLPKYLRLAQQCSE